jgi:hypothetical protein
MITSKNLYGRLMQSLSKGSGYESNGILIHTDTIRVRFKELLPVMLATCLVATLM